MPSFSIHCTTCKSRLKVRDESAIGQIVACPKCGSMVMIEAPSEPVEPISNAAQMPDTVGDSTFGNSFEEAASWFDEDSPTDPTADESTREEATATKAAAVATAAAHVTPPSAPPPPAEQEPAEPVEAPLLPGDAWTSTATANMKRIGLVAGAAVLGIAGVVGLAIAVTTSGGSGDPTSPEVAEQTNNPTETPNENEPFEADVPPVEPIDEPEPSPPSDPESELPAEEPGNPLSPTEPTPPLENEDPAVDVPPSIAEPTEPLENPQLANPPTDPGPADEPPLFVEQPAPVPSTPTNSGLEALDALLPYLDGPEPESDPTPEPVPNEPVPPSETRDPLLEPEPAPVEEPIDTAPTKPEPRAVDVAARLNDPIEAIEFPETPLVDFFRLMSDFSTIPITIDPIALTQYRISPDDSIAVVMGKTTVGEVLQKAATLENLVLEIGDDQIVVTHNRSTTGPMRQMKYPVNDLIGQDVRSLTRLKQLVTIHVAPGSWQETGGVGEIEMVPGGLMIKQSEPVHHAAVLFIEKLRLARGLPKKSHYDQLLFDTEGRRAALEAKLEQNLSLNFFEPTRLLTIVDRLESISGLHITVDWQALLANGWTPDTEARLTAADAPLGEVLDQLLEPREWTFQVISPTWIQITTEAALAKQREVEFHTVGELLQRKAWQPSDLQAALLAELTIDGDEVRPVLGFDTESGTLVVSASPRMQSTIRRLLKEM